MGVQSLQQSRC